MGDVTMQSLQSYAPCLIFNSLQDSAVGEVGKRSLDSLLEKCDENGRHSMEVTELTQNASGKPLVTLDSTHQGIWYDIDSFKTRLAWSDNRDHNWYDAAFAQ